MQGHRAVMVRVGWNSCEYNKISCETSQNKYILKGLHKRNKQTVIWKASRAEGGSWSTPASALGACEGQGHCRCSGGFRAVQISDLACVDLSTPMIMSSHGWDFACGGRPGTEFVAQQVHQHQHLHLSGAFPGQKHFKSIGEIHFSTQLSNQLAKLFFGEQLLTRFCPQPHHYGYTFTSKTLDLSNESIGPENRVWSFLCNLSFILG